MTVDKHDTTQSPRRYSTTFLEIDEALHQQMLARGRACVLDSLAQKSGLERSQVKKAMKCGALWLTVSHKGSIKPVRIRRLQRKFSTGDGLTLYFNSNVLGERCPDALLVEDCVEYSVWNKPAGMLCQGSRWGDHTTLSRWIERQPGFGRPVYIIHRLDKMTEGLIIVAHSKRAVQLFARMFSERAIRKVYQAVCIGRPELELPYRIEQAIDGRDAVSVIERIQPARELICRTGAGIEEKQADSLTILPISLENPVKCREKLETCCLLVVSIESGRKHQIRRHLAGLGYPVLGDRQASSTDFCSQPTPVNEINLQLKAVELKFVCPLTQREKLYKV